MIICVCHRVSDRDIARAVQDGCTRFEELQHELKVATGCGKCGECARETLHSLVARAGQAVCAPLHPARTIPIAASRRPDAMPAVLG